MIIPDKLKIFGYLYDVILNKESDGRETLGQLSGQSQKIFILDSQHQQQKESTLFHEIFEAIDFHFELKLPHQTIAILETALYQILSDNNLLDKGENKYGKEIR